MNAPALPPVDFFVIGAQKCATSWLYLCLRDHPQALLHAGKNEANYIGGPRYRQLGAEWFAGLYAPAPAARVRGAVSVDYLFDVQALEFVLRNYPRARFVACVREPLDRARSAFEFLSRRGVLQGQTLDEGMRAALAAWRAQQAPLPVAAELIGRGMYARQLAPFARHDAWSRLLLVGYERLCRDPRGVLESIYDFVGLSRDFVPASFADRPKVNAHLPWLERFERALPGSRVAAKLADHANRWAVRLGLDRPAPGFAPALAAELRAVFRVDVGTLEQQLGAVPPAQRLFRHGPAADWGFAS